MSQYRMSVAPRSTKRRSFDVGGGGGRSGPRVCSKARSRPTERVNSFLSRPRGSTGRILALYRARVPAERILVETTAELERDPGATIDRVLRFLGLPAGYRPEDLGLRHNRGGLRKRIDAEAEAQLRSYMSEQIWPYTGERTDSLQRAFDFFMETWNAVPEERLPELSPANRSRLRAHYEEDAARLAQIGVPAPWLEDWNA